VPPDGSVVAEFVLNVAFLFTKRPTIVAGAEIVEDTDVVNSCPFPS